MGPTNVALVKLYQADQQLREAEARYDSASRSVRVQERRINELGEKLRLLQTQLREQQSQAAQLDLDLKTRDAKIEKLRTQQTNAKNHKEYQIFLTEINTEKVDKAKVEEEALKAMEIVETQQKELAELSAQLEGEKQRHAETSAQLAGKLGALQAEVDRLKPARDEAAQNVPPRYLVLFERLADRFEGEAMAAIAKPDKRVEEYLCTACNLSLVADVYNRLHTRDELVTCPSCQRMLYIPDDLPPETAVHKPKERKENRGKAVPAAVGRQSSAIDVARSINMEEDESGEGSEAGEGSESGEGAEATTSDEPASAEQSPPQG